MRLRSSNPAFNDKIFTSIASPSLASSGEVMTLEGAVNKSIWCVLLCIATGYWAYSSPGMMALFWPLLIATFIGGIVMRFKPAWSPFLAPAYALGEGLLLGALSRMYEFAIEAQFAAEGGMLGSAPDLAIQAVSLTFGVLFCMLMAYRSGVIKVTDKFRMIVGSAAGAILFVYLISIVLNLFGVSVPFIHSAGPIGIGFSLIVVGVASFYLAISFDDIKKLADSNSAPKYMEWYAAFGLLAALVWLYLEILRLLYLLYASRD